VGGELRHKAVGPGLLFGRLHIRQRLLAGLPHLARNESHVPAVCAVGFVDEMGTADRPVEDDRATQCPFTHDDTFPVFAATSPKDHFCVEAVITGIHRIRAVELGCSSPMLELQVPALLVCLVRDCIGHLLSQAPLVLSSVPQGLQVVISVEGVGFARSRADPGFKLVEVVADDVFQEIATIGGDQAITGRFHSLRNTVDQCPIFSGLFNDLVLGLNRL
jgi:hypothetical protein